MSFLTGFTAIPHELFQWGIGVAGSYKERDVKFYYWFELGMWLRCMIYMVPLEVSEKLKDRRGGYLQLTTTCDLRNATEIYYTVPKGKGLGEIVCDRESVIVILEELRKTIDAVESGLFEQKIIQPTPSP